MNFEGHLRNNKEGFLVRTPRNTPFWFRPLNGKCSLFLKIVRYKSFDSWHTVPVLLSYCCMVVRVYWYSK